MLRLWRSTSWSAGPDLLASCHWGKTSNADRKKLFKELQLRSLENLAGGFQMVEDGSSMFQWCLAKGSCMICLSTLQGNTIASCQPLRLRVGTSSSPAPFSGWHPDKNAAWRHPALPEWSKNILEAPLNPSQVGDETRASEMCVYSVSALADLDGDCWIATGSNSWLWLYQLRQLALMEICSLMEVRIIYCVSFSCWTNQICWPSVSLKCTEDMRSIITGWSWRRLCTPQRQSHFRVCNVCACPN